MVTKMNPIDFVKKTIKENEQTYTYYMDGVDAEFMGIFITLMDFRIRTHESLINTTGLYRYYMECLKITQEEMVKLKIKLKDKK